MAIPDFQSIMLPLLRLAADGTEHRYRDTVDQLETQFGLSEEERKALLPSGVARLFENRVGWAKSFLTKAALLESLRRGYFKITQRGLDVLKKKPSRIDMKFLDQFPEYRDFRASKKPKSQDGKSPEPEESVHAATPEESIEAAHQDLRASLASDLLKQLRICPTALFEKTMVDLLVAMGYGGSRKDAGEAIGKSGDEGVDGIIKEDRLGLDVVYIQAKQWKPDNTVGRPDIQKFAGALQGHHAKKGVFITTSDFSREAREYAAKIDSKIVLIEGERLAHLLIDNNIGVAPVARFEVKRLDIDYFSEDA